jgi:hypothetical protein
MGGVTKKKDNQKELMRFIKNTKDSINSLNLEQEKNQEVLNIHNTNVVKTILELKEFTDSNWTKKELMKDSLEQNISLVNEILDGLEEKFGVNNAD